MDKPNIVFLFPDQFRSDFSGCYGADWLETPNIDRIAADGIRYTNAFSASPICVPARTALLTGMNAIKNGVTDNLHNLRAD
ncbi:MAG: sulfatase, partial [SAR202 cluster bacterium]|nr:sulfatase [SAR202 cluster bacterium]